jgi:hypothetical protein
MNYHQRKHYRESRPFTYAATRSRHCAAVQFNQVTDNRQPEAKPAMRASKAGVRLPETLEGVRQKLRADPLPVIAYGNFYLRVTPPQMNLHPPLPGSEFHGVR